MSDGAGSADSTSLAELLQNHFDQKSNHRRGALPWAFFPDRLRHDFDEADEKDGCFVVCCVCHPGGLRQSAASSSLYKLAAHREGNGRRNIWRPMLWLPRTPHPKFVLSGHERPFLLLLAKQFGAPIGIGQHLRNTCQLCFSLLCCHLLGAPSWRVGHAAVQKKRSCQGSY